MALRPRLLPGVPLSRDGKTDLQGGTRVVKHGSSSAFSGNRVPIMCQVGTRIADEADLGTFRVTRIIMTRWVDV